MHLLIEEINFIENITLFSLCHKSPTYAKLFNQQHMSFVPSFFTDSAWISLVSIDIFRFPVRVQEAMVIIKLCLVRYTCSKIIIRRIIQDGMTMTMHNYLK